MAHHTTLSVRGGATLTVAPDHVVVNGALGPPPAPCAEATAGLREGQDATAAALRTLGGQVRVASDAPALDPVPQEIRAVVEARLTAEVTPPIAEDGVGS